MMPFSVEQERPPRGEFLAGDSRKRIQAIALGLRAGFGVEVGSWYTVQVVADAFFPAKQESAQEIATGSLH
jgi:hypothetical protein